MIGPKLKTWSIFFYILSNLQLYSSPEIYNNVININQQWPAHFSQNALWQVVTIFDAIDIP